MPPMRTFCGLFGSTESAWSYHTCPRVKSAAGISESLSTGNDMFVQLTPLSIDLRRTIIGVPVPLVVEFSIKL